MVVFGLATGASHNPVVVFKVQLSYVTIVEVGPIGTVKPTGRVS